MWANGRCDGAHPARRHRPEPEPVSLRPDARPGRQRADPGRAAARARRRRAVEHRAHRARAAARPRRLPRSSSPTARRAASTAAWVAGCDGSRSAVREMSGIGFPGAPYEHDVLRRRYRGDRADGAGRAQRLSVAGRLPPVLPDARQGPLAGDRHPARAAARARDHVRSRKSSRRSARGGRRPGFKRCDWFSTYRIHHRAAERFRDRRCFLLGDAAHVHSPMGGQGMNTGLQDAYNLAWKLALVVEGRADAALLDSYEAGAHPGRAAPAARRPTARSSCVVSDGWFAALLRTRIIARVAATRDDVRARAASSRSAPSRRSASAIRRARCRRRSPACRRARRGRRPLPVAAAQAAERTARPRTSSAGSTTRASTCS